MRKVRACMCAPLQAQPNDNSHFELAWVRVNGKTVDPCASAAHGLVHRVCMPCPASACSTNKSLVSLMAPAVLSDGPETSACPFLMTTKRESAPPEMNAVSYRTSDG